MTPQSDIRPLIRLCDLSADLDLALALRKAKRPRRQAAARKGAVTKRIALRETRRAHG